MVSQPKSPDPYATANAQNQQNAYASQYNSASGNVNEINPFGSVSYDAIEQVPIYTNGVVSGYAPRYQKTTTLAPDQQKLHGLETQSKYNMGTAAVEQTAKLRDHLNTSLDPAKWQQWTTDLKAQQLRQDAGPTDRAGIENAMMASYDRTTKPQLAAKEAELAARGMSPGGKGYGTYQANVADSRAEQARQAYLASGNESRAAQAAYNDVGLQRFGMDEKLAAYYNNLRGAQMSEDIALRNQPINEVTALMSGSQATIPQFQPFQSSPVAASNIAQYINDNYKTQSAAASATNAGIASIAGGGLKAIMGGMGTG